MATVTDAIVLVVTVLLHRNSYIFNQSSLFAALARTRCYFTLLFLRCCIIRYRDYATGNPQLLDRLGTNIYVIVKIEVEFGT